jgi:hypothetical protein
MPQVKPKTSGLALVLFLAWIIEWITGFNTGVTVIDRVIGLASLAAYGYFVINSREKLSRSAHAIVWMLAIIAIAIVRALLLGWWLRGDGLMMEIARMAPAPHDLGDKADLALADAIFTSCLLGFVYGVAGAAESMLASVFGWIGDLLQDRTPSRVPFLPRLAVVVLHMPLYCIVCSIGLGALAGIAAGFGQSGAHVIAAGGVLAAVIAVGIAGCVIATVQVICLRALVDGGRLPRLLLGGFSVVAYLALVVMTWPSLRVIVVATIWCGAQLAALRWARPSR